uniref:Uncharacterized protein n=1 Tax=Parascaris equorum TaxID=6256 RepID=A0A914R2H4_PAREQ
MKIRTFKDVNEKKKHSESAGNEESVHQFSLTPKRKKHIAYVAPESHHSNSMMDEESCTDDEFNSVGSRAIRSRQMSISESRRRTTQRTHGTREQSISPTVRRSPVSRIKERSTTRQQCAPMRR